MQINFDVIYVIISSGVLPASIILALSFFGVFLWAVISASDNIHECTSKGKLNGRNFIYFIAGPQWVIFSGSQLLIVQLFLINVIYICWYVKKLLLYIILWHSLRKLNQVRTVRINRWSQKAQLILLVLTIFFSLYLVLLYSMVSTYEIVSVAVFCYDLYLVASTLCWDNIFDLFFYI